MSSMPLDPAARRRTRRIMVQLLYQWGLTQDDIASLQQQFEQEVVSKDADREYFVAILEPLFEKMDTIDRLITDHKGDQVHTISLVEQSVLRLAVFELVHRMDIPAPVIINEALDLNKRFGAPEGHRFINAVLDIMLQELRPFEKKK